MIKEGEYLLRWWRPFFDLVFDNEDSMDEFHKFYSREINKFDMYFSPRDDKFSYFDESPGL